MKLLNFIADPTAPAKEEHCSCCGRNTKVKQFNQDFGVDPKHYVLLCKLCEGLARKIGVGSFSINEGHWKFVIAEAQKQLSLGVPNVS